MARHRCAPGRRARASELREGALCRLRVNCIRTSPATTTSRKQLERMVTTGRPWASGAVETAVRTDECNSVPSAKGRAGTGSYLGFGAGMAASVASRLVHVTANKWPGLARGAR